jgi:beta-lactamase class D
MNRLVLLTATLFFSLSGSSQKVIVKDFKAQFAKYGVDGCFVLFSQSGNEYIRYNPALCDSGFIPASTFKIPNSLIFLEEGVIKDTLQLIKWDGHKWPNDNWNQDQTLRTAIKYSCVWVYTTLAEMTGIDKYKKYISSFDYGNKDLSGPPTRFWLNGPFRISANQQINFLRKFYNYKLPVSKPSVDIVKNLIIIEQTDLYKLSGKTGGGVLSEDEYVMWLVGYLERHNKTYFYAMNFRTSEFDKMIPFRYSIVKDILRELGLINQLTLGSAENHCFTTELHGILTPLRPPYLLSTGYGLS